MFFWDDEVGKNGVICGIDEAGRGCVAGPLCVAGCILKKQIAGLDDSKKLSEKRRNELFTEITANSHYKIVEFSNSQVNEMGLSKCLKTALESIVEFFKDFDCEIIYDGNTTFGADGFKTLVKADATIPAVSAASILAKVSRDKKMLEFDKKFPEYGFKKNKGYGSKTHIEAIEKFGLTPCHRKSFKIKSLSQKSLF